MKVSTSLNVYNSCKIYEEGIKRAKESGFEFFDAALRPSEFEIDNWRERYKEIKEYADSLGVKMYQSHVHFVVGEYDDYEKEMMKRTIEAAAILGAEWTVIHPIDVKSESVEERIKANMEFLTPFIEFAKEVGIGIAIENKPRRVYWYGDALCEQTCYEAEELIKLCDALNDKFGNVGICWDTGHANLPEREQYEEIKLLGDRLKCLHIADNDGQYDDHMPPFYGYIDFKAIMKALKEINYSGTFNFETHKFTHRLPDELIDDAVRLLYKIGEYVCNNY